MDDRALNQLVSIKHLRPFRHGSQYGDQEVPEQPIAFDKKHIQYKEKPVNIHRVINLKKQYKQ